MKLKKKVWAWYAKKNQQKKNKNKKTIIIGKKQKNKFLRVSIIIKDLIPTFYTN